MVEAKDALQRRVGGGRTNLPFTGTNTLREGTDAVEYSMDVRNNILPVDIERLAARGTKSHVHHGAVLGDVDVLTSSHGSLTSAGAEAQRVAGRKGVAVVVVCYGD